MNRNDNYIDAYIELRVPKWQIGEEATIYFKDTMLKDENEKIKLYTKLTRLASVLTVIIFI